MSTASYLDRILEPMTDVLTPEVARALAGLRASPDLEADVEELRRKANEGSLTPEEDAKYKEFVEAVDVVSIIQSKARQFLAKHAQ
jgi:pantoate kinase